MLVPETNVHERCPNCSREVVVSGFRESYDDEATYVDDLIGSSIPCSGCGTELTYDSQKEWDDRCFVCNCPYREEIALNAEWQSHRNCYRWWCPSCSSNFVAALLAEGSRPLARLLRLPLLPLSLIVLCCGHAWFELHGWWRKATATHISN